MTSNFPSNLRPVASNTYVDPKSIKSVTNLPKPWPEGVTLCIVDTWDGDAMTCVEVKQ